MKSALKMACRSLVYPVVVLTILMLAQSEARADEVFIAGNTNGCFGLAPCVPGSTGGAYQPGITTLGLTYNNAVFSGTTAGGTLGLGGNPVAGGLNANNLGSFTLSTSPAVYAGQQFTLRVTFTDPQGIAGNNSPVFSATLVGTVVSDTNGGVLINFNSAPVLFTFNDINCGATTVVGQQTTCGTGSFQFSINNLALNPGQTASLTGFITSAQQTAIPEPTTMILLGTGLTMLAAAGRRRLNTKR